jgi:hypothetical protein
VQGVASAPHLMSQIGRVIPDRMILCVGWDRRVFVWLERGKLNDDHGYHLVMSGASTQRLASPAAVTSSTAASTVVGERVVM